MGYSEWKQRAEAALRSKFGIGVDDCAEDSTMQEWFEEGSTPAEFTEHIGDKYDLIAA